MIKQFTLLLVGFVVAIYVVIKIIRGSSSIDEQAAAACAGPVLTLEARNAATEEGNTINRVYNCIDKASYEAVNREKAIAQAARQKAQDTPRVAADESVESLADARKDFKTAIVVHGARLAIPHPPSSLFVRSDYESEQGALPAFVTPNPDDGQKHPAIVWLTGGDSNSLDDFWTPGPESSDQSASAFRKAGMVMMFPTLRGGNENQAGKEFFFGEVNDILAAADHLAHLPYVDADRIYLGGHSTGGTLALLTAEVSARFKAVFAFGPVDQVDRYPSSIVPVDFRQYDRAETKLRSPIHWLHGIATPTLIIEGEDAPSNIDALHALCSRNKNEQLKCIPVKGANHFSVLSKVTRVIAARLAVGVDNQPFVLRAEEFAAVAE